MRAGYPRSYPKKATKKRIKLAAGGVFDPTVAQQPLPAVGSLATPHPVALDTGARPVIQPIDQKNALDSLSNTDRYQLANPTGGAYRIGRNGVQMLNNVSAAPGSSADISAMDKQLGLQQQVSDAANQSLAARVGSGNYLGQLANATTVTPGAGTLALPRPGQPRVGRQPQQPLGRQPQQPLGLADGGVIDTIKTAINNAKEVWSGNKTPPPPAPDEKQSVLEKTINAAGERNRALKEITNYADGAVLQETPEQMLARMNAKYGLGASSAPTPAPQQQPSVENPKPAPSGGLLDGLLGRAAKSIGNRNEEMKKAANYACGGVMKKGYADGALLPVKGKGTGRSDDVPAVVAGKRVNLSNGEGVAVLPAKTMATPGVSNLLESLIHQTNGRPSATSQARNLERGANPEWFKREAGAQIAPFLQDLLSQDEGLRNGRSIFGPSDSAVAPAPSTEYYGGNDNKRLTNLASSPPAQATTAAKPPARDLSQTPGFVGNTASPSGVVRGQFTGDVTRMTPPPGAGSISRSRDNSGAMALPADYADTRGNPTQDWTETQRYADATASNAKDKQQLQGYFLQHLLSGDLEGATRTANSPQDQAMLGLLLAQRGNPRHDPGALLQGLSALTGLSQAQEGQNLAKQGAQLDLAGKQAGLDQQRQLQKLLALHQIAKTPEEKSALEDRILLLTGKFQPDSYGHAQGGQVTDPTTGMPTKTPDSIYSRKTGAPPPTSRASANNAGTLAKGDIRRKGDGAPYRFKGGDPSNPDSWEQA